MVPRTPDVLAVVGRVKDSPCREEPRPSLINDLGRPLGLCLIRAAHELSVFPIVLALPMLRNETPMATRLMTGVSAIRLLMLVTMAGEICGPTSCFLVA